METNFNFSYRKNINFNFFKALGFFFSDCERSQQEEKYLFSNRCFVALAKVQRYLAIKNCWEKLFNKAFQ